MSVNIGLLNYFGYGGNHLHKLVAVVKNKSCFDTGILSDLLFIVGDYSRKLIYPMFLGMGFQVSLASSDICITSLNPFKGGDTFGVLVD